MPDHHHRRGERAEPPPGSIRYYTPHSQALYLPCIVPPSILATHQDQLITARLGQAVTLRCNASGVPRPDIHWYKSVGSVPGSVSCSGSCYTIPHVSLAAGGDYICSASNGVGQPQHATIHVNILGEDLTAKLLICIHPLHMSVPPSVSSMVTGQVMGGGGGVVRLECRVEGEPPPTIQWVR